MVLRKILKIFSIIALTIIFIVSIFVIYINNKMDLIVFPGEDESLKEKPNYFGKGLSLEELGDVQELKEMKAIESEQEMIQNKGVFNILLIGTDERTNYFSENARADTCMILSINSENGQIKLVSLQRGMGVPILDGAYMGNYDWLTHTFRYGGAELLLREVRECFNIDVQYYVRVNFKTFINGINSIGGIDIDLTSAEASYITSKTGSNLVEGQNHLNGEDALHYARCRKIDSDWRRIERQRNVIQAAANTLKGKNLIEINDTFNEVLPLVETNLTKQLILAQVVNISKLKEFDIKQMTIPADGTFGSMIGLGGRSLYAVDFNANSKILNDFLYNVHSLTPLSQ